MWYIYLLFVVTVFYIRVKLDFRMFDVLLKTILLHYTIYTQFTPYIQVNYLLIYKTIVANKKNHCKKIFPIKKSIPDVHL